MSIYAIGDLHLSLNNEKSMDVFGGWNNYVDRLSENWRSVVAKDDLVVLCGDISWSMKLSECYKDFTFINELPGKKLIIKGNHDYWWCTMSKMVKYLNDNSFESISFLHNNAYIYENIAVCGTRGWLLEDSAMCDEKVSAREAGRLEASLKAGEGYSRIAFLHYPPLFGYQRSQNMIDILHKYGVKTCFYGHIHGAGIPFAPIGEYDNILFKLISADALSFMPYKIC